VLFRSEGAAANDLTGHISEDEKQDRLQEFMEVQAEISASKLATKVGQRMTVIVDGQDEHGSITRRQADAPEVDGVVYVEGEFDLPAGEFVEVEITNSDAYDLYARLVD